jgi:hypothetical protein
MRTSLSLCLVFLLAGLLGCQYYEEYRNTKGEADIKEEKAELLKAHRLCLQKYESDPAVAKERCASYTQAIQDFERRTPAAK